MTTNDKPTDAGPLAVDHVVDFYRRYPGETVTFYTRVRVRRPLPGFTLRIHIPEGMILGDYRAPLAHGPALPEVHVGALDRYFAWKMDQEVQPGDYEYQVEAQIPPVSRDLTLESKAVVTVQMPDETSVVALETVTIAVRAKGRYLQHLPAIYHEDDLMSRFLMLFEDFWDPIEKQVDTIHSYFDPGLTPSEVLPWLASWLDLTFDNRWPDQKRRQLLRRIALLYRKRGTKPGLKEYIEVLTGTEAEIMEHRAENFVLGPMAKLGPGIALGRDNTANSFTVLVRVPPDAGEEASWVDRRLIESIVDAEKPAHTSYILRMETATAEE